MRPQIGSFLVKQGLIQEKQLESALVHQKRMGGRLGGVLLSLRYISAPVMLDALAKYYQCPATDLGQNEINPELIRAIQPEMARNTFAVPVRDGVDSRGRKTLFVALKTPDDLGVIDQISFASGYVIKPMVALDSSIDRAVEYYYPEKVIGSQFSPLPDQGRGINFEDFAPEKLEHFYEDADAMEVVFQEPFQDDSVANLDIHLSDEVDSRTYVKYLIKKLYAKGVLTKEDLKDFLI